MFCEWLDRMIEEWRHVFKLDPEKEIGDEALEALCLSGTDAILVGGSSGVTYDNTVDLLARIRRYETPCALEVTTIDAIVPGFDAYLIPVVLNSTDVNCIVGQHVAALQTYGRLLPKDSLYGEGYIIANPECTAAKVSSAAPVTADLIAAYAQYADRLLRLPIVYIEYSGMFGDLQAVSRVKDLLGQARLFYGGGIDSLAKAQEAAAAADTIVVGNVIYTSLQDALQTVRMKDS